MSDSLNNYLQNTSIYVIHTLKGYEEHEKHVNKLMKNHGLTFEFVTDGDIELNDKESLSRYFNESILEKANPGAISCTLNHFFALKKFIESGKKYAIIFENDPFFLRNFNNKLLRIYKDFNFLPDNFIVSIENTTLQFPSFFQVKKDKVLYEAKKSRMAGAYIISRKGAENALEFLKKEKCNFIIDWWINELIDNKIVKMFWAYPPLVEQGSHNGKLHSTISSKKKSLQRQVSWNLQKFYKMYIRRFFNDKNII